MSQRRGRSLSVLAAVVLVLQVLLPTQWPVRVASAAQEPLPPASEFSALLEGTVPAVPWAGDDRPAVVQEEPSERARSAPTCLSSSVTAQWSSHPSKVAMSWS